MITNKEFALPKQIKDVSIEVRSICNPKEENVPYIGLEHIEQNSLSLNGVGASNDVTSSKKCFEKGDILLGTLRPYFRKVYYSTFSGLCSTDITVIRTKEINSRFLFYNLADYDFINYCSKISNGTRMPRVAWKSASLYKIKVPPIQNQKKIAGVLAAFDELIEVNRRKIKILEEMAQAVYNEWFVKMRFPCHEKYAPPIGNGDGTAPYRVFDSPLGPIPEGWDCMPLKEYADVQYGYPFKSNLFSNDSNGEMVIRIRNIMNDNSDTFTSEYAGNEYEVVDNDILVGMDGDFYTSIWKGGKAYLNQRVARLRSRIYDNQCYLYYSIKKPIEYFNNIIVGTTVAHLSDKEFGSIKIIKPAKEVEHHFSIILKSIVDTCINISKQNQSLSSLRDLLLPKLISGKIDVSELDIDEYALGDC